MGNEREGRPDTEAPGELGLARVEVRIFAEKTTPSAGLRPPRCRDGATAHDRPDCDAGIPTQAAVHPGAARTDRQPMAATLCSPSCSFLMARPRSIVSNRARCMNMRQTARSEEHTSELQSLMRNS